MSLKGFFGWQRDFGHRITALIFFAFMWGLRRLPLRKSSEWLEKGGSALSPLLPRTRQARENLRLAFPEKTPEEVNEILRRMWGLLARSAVEYAQLSLPPERREWSGNEREWFEFEENEAFRELKALDGPAILFTAHLGAWEMIPLAAADMGVPFSSLFRAPNNPYIARGVSDIREVSHGDMIASKAGAAWELAGVLEAGGKIGLLADQYYPRGIPVRFFGRETKANPMAAQLARRFDCPVYPSLCVRLPEGRFRFRLEPKIELPRDEQGEVAVNPLTQRMHDGIEAWIREDPAQWLWLHRKWRR